MCAILRQNRAASGRRAEDCRWPGVRL